MKSPLRRLRGFGHHYPKERKAHAPPPAKLDELAEAAQDVEQMRKCYDGLLSAAAATTNSVYEFSEALEEMGSCLLAKNALNDEDDDSGELSTRQIIAIYGVKHTVKTHKPWVLMHL